jgi:hypothetical protein
MQVLSEFGKILITATYQLEEQTAIVPLGEAASESTSILVDYVIEST